MSHVGLETVGWRLEAKIGTSHHASRIMIERQDTDDVVVLRMAQGALVSRSCW